jgi:hypothetical protein
MEEKIVISVEEYRNLILTAHRYMLIRDAVFENAAIGWDGERMTANNDGLFAAIRIICPEEYQARLAELKGEENGND